MRKILLSTLFVMLSIVMVAKDTKKGDKMTFVLIETSLREIKVGLYDDTPLHRDNFLKLVEDKFYDGVLFHRIIKDFMIQAGDPMSKVGDPDLRLGAGDIGYKIPAEINFPARYHKHGALAAARQGDAVNPKRESSGCQFYIVQGKTFTEEELKSFESRINASRSADQQIKYSDEQRMQYKIFGGTPHLDDQYTVFGEVIEGFDVLKAIAEVKTGAMDRPVEDIKILSMRVVRK